MVVTKVPRVPFLAHSEILLQHLLSLGNGPCRQVLEIGCGENSPLLPMLQRVWPEVRLHQIDVRPEIVAKAAAHNPHGKVEHMFGSSMGTIEDQAKEAVVAMSVFDQNPDSEIVRTAKEVHRVLASDGIAVYIHNEELNPPATAASMLYRSFRPLQYRDEPRYMLPSNLWQPTNDLEYCSGKKVEIDQALQHFGPDGHLLQRYIHELHPDPSRLSRMKSTGDSVSFVGDCTVPMMNQVRQIVATLRSRYPVELVDYSTADLIAHKIETQLFAPEHGFEILCGGVFELRQSIPWQTFFRQRPDFVYAVRGLPKFGYMTDAEPSPVSRYRQELNSQPARQEDEITLIAYQYGAVARKVDMP